MPDSTRLLARLDNRFNTWQAENRLVNLARQVAIQAPPSGDTPPVIFFNASTRIGGLSQNAAFSLLSSWAVRFSGVPVVHFVCQAGLLPCVLGLNRQDYTQPPPCHVCKRLSSILFTAAKTQPFHYHTDPNLEGILAGMDVNTLSVFEHQVPAHATQLPGQPTIPLGALVLPSTRWALRRHHLNDDPATRYLLRQYILSAYNIILEFAGLIRQVNPSSAVIFNGILYPEAAARWTCRQLGLPNVAHEVGFQPLSVFFSDQEPTAYPIHIPETFQLNSAQESALDAYLEQRFQGKFSMAGICFWPEMRGLEQDFLEKAARFKQVVPVFTNVVFDTSQVHANTVFPQMFAWLDLVLEIIREAPETLFVIRAHPDEKRPGSDKQSNESVSDWVQQHGVADLPNVVFIDSLEYLSSYELINRAKFSMVYNSSIGMEAALLGAVVLCGGQARYTQYPMVYFPESPAAYRQQARMFLEASNLKAPVEFQTNARRFLYYQLYRASLPLDEFLKTGRTPGLVEIKQFPFEKLHLDRSVALGVIRDGILKGQLFIMPEPSV